jgi:adenylate cyclase
MPRERPLSVDQPRRRWTLGPDPLAGDEQPTFEGVVRELRKVPATRLIVTALILAWAILFARYSWEAPVDLPVFGKTIPISTDAERALFDFREVTGENQRKVAQDNRIILIPYTQDTLKATQQRSPLSRTMLSRALANIDRMGAKAIGIDILIDQPQPDDGLMLATLKGMRTPVKLAYATRATAGPEVEQWQQEFMNRWFAQLHGTQVQPASVRFEPDTDNVLRRWPSLPPGLATFLPMAVTGARPNFSYRGSIDFRLPSNASARSLRACPSTYFQTPQRHRSWLIR